MLQITLGVKGKPDMILASGTMIQVHADCLRAIGGMYQQFKQHSPILGGDVQGHPSGSAESPRLPHLEGRRCAGSGRGGFRPHLRGERQGG